MTYRGVNAGRVTTEKLDGVTLATVSYRADTAALDPGVLESVAYANNTSGAFSYDTLGRVVSITWTGPGGTITSDTVTRSLSGKVLTDSIDGVLAWTYTYDSVGRLTRATGSGHDYQYGYGTTSGCPAPQNDPNAGLNSKRTSLSDNGTTVQSACYDSADRLVNSTQGAVTTTPAYDYRGRTTTIGTDSYTYDAADRHLTTTGGGTTVTYTRDATDRVVARSDSSTGQTVRYSGNTVLTASNTVFERTLALPGGVLVTTRASGDVWSYPNVHGDITATCDTTGAKQGSTRVYDPYGNTASLPDNSTGNWDYGWVGQHVKGTEHAPGLTTTIEMGARIYSPNLGRFLTPDPIEGGTPNDYTYPDDPINSWDLNGQCGIGNPFKKCGKGHKGCTGWLTCAASGAKTVGRAATRAAANVYRHTTVGVSACLILCADLKFQGGHLSVGVGGIGLAKAVPVYIGWANKRAKDRETCSAMVGGGVLIVGNMSLGMPSDRIAERALRRHIDVETDIGIGVGVWGGGMCYMGTHIPGFPE